MYNLWYEGGLVSILEKIVSMIQWDCDGCLPSMLCYIDLELKIQISMKFYKYTIYILIPQ